MRLYVCRGLGDIQGERPLVRTKLFPGLNSRHPLFSFDLAGSRDATGGARPGTGACMRIK